MAIALIGVRALLAPTPAPDGKAAGRSGLLRDYASILAITLANPPTILSFAALAAALGPPRRGGAGAVALVVAGVFLGSTTWWTVLTGAVAAARRQLGLRLLTWTARASGLLLVGFGALVLLPALR